MGTDSRPESELRDDARELGIPLFAGGHDVVPFEIADLVVVSPGVPAFAALERAEAAGIAVIGEIELASRFARAPIVAVGGTNGKSTVTTAVAALFEAAGQRVFAGGNLGTPLADAVLDDFEVLVVEVSSFQLERAPTFHPKAAVLLNVTEDHLDRYPSFQSYADAKGNAFVNQGLGDVAVVPATASRTRTSRSKGPTSSSVRPERDFRCPAPTFTARTTNLTPPQRLPSRGPSASPPRSSTRASGDSNHWAIGCLSSQ